MLMAFEFITSVVFWIWFGIMVATIIFEAVTPTDLVSIWFACGAFVALIVAMIAPQLIWLQIVLFTVVSLILVFSTRKLARKMQNVPDMKTNIDSIVGQTGKVTIEILPHEIGEVKVEGKLWSAISEVSIPKDAYVEVLAVDGVKLVVQALEDETNK